MLSVREIETKDIQYIADYWTKYDPDHMQGMGVDIAKLPSEEQVVGMLEHQIRIPHQEKSSYALIWDIDGQPSGHCNVNNIIFGQEAFMHLHLWNAAKRRQGMGVQLVRQSLPYFFEKLELRELFCEPYALNPAPNKTLEKAGFEFIKEWTTIPGSVNFEQPVKRWRMTREAYLELGINP